MHLYVESSQYSLCIPISPSERVLRNTEAADSQISCPQIEVLRGRDGRDGGVGPPGPTGSPGEKGKQGEVGIQGENGTKGEVGLPGEKGGKGLVGRQGPVGPSAPRGEIGEKGERGYPGLAGPQGPPQGGQGVPKGGVVYVRWGRSVCPTGQGTEQVYNGTAGGSYWNQKGGAVNIVCMPNNPEHGAYGSGVQGDSHMGGAAINIRSSQPMYNIVGQNLFCAVCLVKTRNTVLTIPGRVSCPANWTLEYSGYLVAGLYVEHRNMFECVDSNPETGGKGGGFNNKVAFYLVEPICDRLGCPPYSAEKELTCAVCSY